MPTALDTAGLRDLGAEVLARAVFTAKGTNAIFADMLKRVIERLAAGEIGEGQARTALYETLDALGYDVEKGGFPGEELEPGLKGTIQDLRSFRRMDLIVRTQRDLMTGAGQKARGEHPDALSNRPAWELVRVMPVEAPRDWPSRWVIAGGSFVDGGRMVALKGHPIWGELGAYDNFPDALGVDFPPFAFNSGMGWREVSAGECKKLKLVGPDGETPDEWLASQPITMSGKMPLPTPRVSLAGVDPEILKKFEEDTKAEMVPGKPGVFQFPADNSDLLARHLADIEAARKARKAS